MLVVPQWSGKKVWGGQADGEAFAVTDKEYWGKALSLMLNQSPSNRRGVACLGLALPVKEAIGDSIIFVHGGGRKVGLAFIDIDKEEVEFTAGNVQNPFAGAYRAFERAQPKGVFYLLTGVGCMQVEWAGLLLKKLVRQGRPGFQQPVEQFCYIMGHSLMGGNEALDVVKGSAPWFFGSP